MPTPTIPAGNLFMNATLWTGNGTSTRTITNGVAGQSFQPDFVWTKSRSNAYYHNLYDVVRGFGSAKSLHSNDTLAEGTLDLTYGYVSAATSSGFSVANGATSGQYVNENGSTYVAWQWKAGGTAVSNTSGSITSSVSANTTSGFSVVTYTGNGVGGATIGHGLGVAPSMMIFKSRNGAGGWLVWHTGYNSNQAQMLLESTAAIYNPGNGLYFNSTYASSTVATLGTSGALNGSGTTYVAYMWSQIAGYSAFGSYTGNGSADGPFIYTGFRPRFVMIKSSTVAATNWTIVDTSRNTYNTANARLFPSSSSAEDTSNNNLNFLSNGFQIANGTDTGVNGSGSTYIYMAFAENPFKYANAR